MKRIKHYLIAVAAFTAGLATVSCTDYQDEIDALDKRVYTLEHLVDSVNRNINALAILVNAQADGWVITGIAEIPGDDETPGGYVISFGKLDKQTGELSNRAEDKKMITIYNGLDGKDGEDGKDGKAPVISVMQDPLDGNFYWTIDGQWLTTGDGQRIRANGKDGKDGKDGEDGEDGKDGVNTAPIIDIDENGFWIVSTDNGETWVYLTDSDGKPYTATGRDGKDGKDGKDGEDGKDGKDAHVIIKGVTIRVDSDGNRYVVFTVVGAGGQGEDVDISLPLKN